MNKLRKSAVTGLKIMRSLSKKRGEVSVDGRPFYSLTYRMKGTVCIKVGERELISTPDSVTFIPKGLSYRTEVREDAGLIAVHFSLAEDLPFAEPQVLAVDRKSTKQFFDRLARRAGEREWSFETMEAFYALLSHLSRLSDERESCHLPEAILRARQMMEESFSDPTTDIERICIRLGVSASYLRREFKRAYGTAPLDFLRGLRINAAKQMLIGEDRTVGQIASACGFGSVSYFIQSFHRETGRSPGEYRRSRRDRALS